MFRSPLPFYLLLGACGSSGDITRHSPAWEHCSGSADCDDGLVCIDQECVSSADADSAQQPSGDSGDSDSPPTSDEGWLDPETGYIWQNPAYEELIFSMGAAEIYCDGLGEGWHLPSIDELRTLIRGCAPTESGGSCGVTDDCLDYSCMNSSCSSCSGSGPADGCFWPDEMEGSCAYYWTSSPCEGDVPVDAWFVLFNSGRIAAGYEGSGYYGSVRCMK